MPRLSSGASVAGRLAPRRPAPARSPPPKQVNRASSLAHVQNSGGGSLLGGIGSTIAQGMAFGTGIAVAHGAIDAVMGPRTIQHETEVSEAVCSLSSSAFDDAGSVPLKAFQDCINSFDNDVSKCQFYMDTLSACTKNSCMLNA